MIPHCRDSCRTDPSSRLLIGLAGIPASGKSSFSQLVVDYTNSIFQSSINAQEDEDPSEATNIALVVGLDGWHLTRAQLDALPDPKLAHDRRGIHWTFDGPAYVEFVRCLRRPLTPTTPIITAPSFDHALKDPTPNAVSIHPRHRVIIIEGLYTFLSIGPWREGGALLDERWFLEVDVDEAQRRLVKRHVVSGVAKDLEEAVWRAEESDMPSSSFCFYEYLTFTNLVPRW